MRSAESLAALPQRLRGNVTPHDRVRTTEWEAAVLCSNASIAAGLDPLSVQSIALCAVDWTESGLIVNSTALSTIELQLRLNRGDSIVQSAIESPRYQNV